MICIAKHNPLCIESYINSEYIIFGKDDSNGKQVFEASRHNSIFTRIDNVVIKEPEWFKDLFWLQLYTKKIRKEKPLVVNYTGCGIISIFYKNRNNYSDALVALNIMPTKESLANIYSHIKPILEFYSGHKEIEFKL